MFDRWIQWLHLRKLFR
jgi:hypothetical protein